MVASLTVNRPQRRSNCACNAQPMSSHEVPPSMESSEGEWRDEDSSDRLLTMMMETIQTVGGQSSSRGVAKGCKFCGNMNQLMTEDNDAFADHVEGDRVSRLNCQRYFFGLSQI
jgi:hypothetical protein